MLPSLIRPCTPPSSSSRPPSPTSVFAGVAINLFLDEERCQHGLPGAAVAYQYSPTTDIVLQIVDPSTDAEHKLFAQYVWNAGVLLAELIGGQTRLHDEAQRRQEYRRVKQHDLPSDESIRLETELWRHDWSVAGESVIEIGAGSFFFPYTPHFPERPPGTALPSIVAALAGATRVVATDYPSPTLLAITRTNLSANTPPALQPRIAVEGHEWSQLDTEFARENAHAFSRVLVADTLWLDKQHAPLRASIAHFLADGGQAWVVAGFHTGREKVTSFLRRAGDQGLAVERVWEVDVNGVLRPWREEREEGVAERKKWCMVTILKRTDIDGEGIESHESKLVDP